MLSEFWKILRGFSIFWSNFLWKTKFLNQNQYKIEIIHLDINGFLFINDSRNILKRFAGFYNAFKSCLHATNMVWRRVPRCWTNEFSAFLVKNMETRQWRQNCVLHSRAGHELCTSSINSIWPFGFEVSTNWAKKNFSRELVSDLMIWPISVHENLIFILGELVSDKPTQRFRREGQKSCS